MLVAAIALPFVVLAEAVVELDVLDAVRSK